MGPLNKSALLIHQDLYFLGLTVLYAYPIAAREQDSQNRMAFMLVTHLIRQRKLHKIISGPSSAFDDPPVRIRIIRIIEVVIVVVVTAANVPRRCVYPKRKGRTPMSIP